MFGQRLHGLCVEKQCYMSVDIVWEPFIMDFHIGSSSIGTAGLTVLSQCVLPMQRHTRRMRDVRPKGLPGARLFVRDPRRILMLQMYDREVHILQLQGLPHRVRHVVDQQ